MEKDVESYIRYCNGIRLHTTIGDVSPIEFENSKTNVCGSASPDQPPKRENSIHFIMHYLLLF